MIKLPCFDVFWFFIPLFGMFIVVCWVVTTSLEIGIYSPFKWTIDLLKPKTESLKGSSTVWIKFKPSLDHFYVGI